jgi:GAF domain-containing protein
MQDPLDEEQWSLFARTGAAAGVESSLSLPVLRDGVVIGGINLYAASPDAFESQVEALAQALGAEASAAVSDADLSFSSRLEAVQAPVRIRDRYDVDAALGILAARFTEPVDESRKRLRRAAAQAGVSEAVVARILIDLHAGR